MNEEEEEFEVLGARISARARGEGRGTAGEGVAWRGALDRRHEQQQQKKEETKKKKKEKEKSSPGSRSGNRGAGRRDRGRLGSFRGAS